MQHAARESAFDSFSLPRWTTIDRGVRRTGIDRGVRRTGEPQPTLKHCTW